MFDNDLLGDVAQLHALAAKIAAGINPTLSGSLAVEALPEVLAAVRQGELACVRLIERADRTGEYRCDGAASITAYVRTMANETNPWASKRVHLGRALADCLPATAKGWEAGHLVLDHAAVIPRATAKVLDSDLVAALESYLALLAPTMTPAELAAVADDLRSQAEPEESAAETAKQHAAQTFHLSQTTDGMWRADGWLDAEAGLIVSTGLTAFLRKADPDGDPLTESIGRRRADALIDICRQALTHADPCTGTTMTRHTIVVGLSHQQLDNDPARTPWFHPPSGRPPRKGQRRGLLNHNQYPLRS